MPIQSGRQFILLVVTDNTTGFNFLFFFGPCCVACGILVPDQGLKLCPLQWKFGVLIHWNARELPDLIYNLHRYCEL